jgi:tetratricopeptide (TPR) repeat protein
MWFLRRHKPYLLTGWLWYLGTLIPMIGLVQVGRQAMADRFSYIPFLGLYIALVWLFSDSVYTFRYHAVLSGMVALCVIAAMIAKTRDQVPYWKNTITLFSHALEIDPRGELPNLALGIAYMRQGSMAQAQQCFNRALLYDPHNMKILSSADMAQAFTLMQMGDLADAGNYMEQAIRLEPSNKDVLISMASHSMNIGRPELAIFYCDRVLAVDSDMVTANVYRAYIFHALGRFDDAVRECNNIISRHPDNTDAPALLGLMYESGQGVASDLVQADFWFIVASATGDSISQGSRFLVASKMTPAEVDQAQELARQWFEKHKK